MKKLIAAVCVTCALSLAAQAEDTQKKHEMTAEHQAAMKELLAKYDTNKDGKLDKEERTKLSTEDKAKLEKLHPMKHKHMEHDAPKPESAPATPAAPAAPPATK